MGDQAPPRDEAAPPVGDVAPDHAPADRDLAPYVSQLLLRWARDHPDRRSDVRDATLVHVDVSGFTALSERLARRGQVGAELLTDAIDGCFSLLLADAAANGGRLLSFGGDALLLLFDGSDHATRGARAGVAMRDSLDAVDAVDAPGGRIRLAMTVGVRTGPTHLLLVGDRHRQLIVAGPAASEVVALEAAARPGEVVIDDATAAALPGVGLGELRGPGRVLTGEVPGRDLPDIGTRRIPPSLVLPFVPEALRDHLRQGSDPEHRRVAVAFVGVRGLGDEVVADLDGTWTALDATVRAVQAAAAKHGVVFLGADVDEGAAKLILVAGAPTGTGDDAARLLLALRELVDDPPPLPLRLGATIGAVFAGDVGPALRRTYTVMGDAVNLAARLHATSTPGTAIVTGELVSASRTAFEVTELPRITVRGRQEPVTPLVLGPVAGTAPGGDAVSDELPLVGRDEELAVLMGALADARGGRGRVVELVGDAGIGKSRLVAEVVARADGVRVAATAGELYRAATPYAATRPLLLAALDLPAGADDDAVRTRLDQVVGTELPQLVPWSPLLAQAAGVGVPDTDATAALAARYRAARLHTAVSELLADRWAAPTLVVVEDLQWTDQASRDLLAELVAGSADRPWLVLTTRREGDAAVADHVEVLPIGPLPASATAVLGEGAADEAPLPPAILEQLTERSGGNPLFLGELLAAARAAGGAQALPDSVGSLLTSRIDRLPAPQRRALRELSVLGASFDAPLAAAVLDVDDHDLAATLAGVAGFVDRDGEVVRFRHNLLRDVAYEGLPFRQRQRLHARAADVLDGDGDTDLGLLSVHAFLAGRMDTAWHASVAAGRAAAATYANVDAARFLTRALEAGRRVPTVSPHDRAEVAEVLGDVQRHLGDVAAATTAYRSARRRSDDEVDLARLALKQARAQAGGQRFSQALGVISRALTRLAPLDGQRAAAQRAELLAWYGHFRQEQGRHADALGACHRAIAEAEAAGATVSLAHALRLLDWIHAERGEFDLAVHSPRSLELFTELGDLPNQASVLNNLGGFAYWAGRWEEAAEHYRRAQELDERTGDVVGAAFTRNNLAEILADQGQLHEAEALLAQAERTFRGTGYTAGIAYVRMNRGRVAAHAGRTERARELLTSALALHREVGAAASAFEADARLAEVALLAGDDDAEVLAAADRLLAHAAADGAVAAAMPLLHRIRGAVLVRRGELDAALAAFATSEQVAHARDADFEVALAQAAHAEVAALAGDERDAAGPRAAGDATFARLGVARVPWKASGRRPG